MNEKERVLINSILKLIEESALTLDRAKMVPDWLRISLSEQIGTIHGKTLFTLSE